MLALKEWFLRPKPCAVLLALRDSQQSWYPAKLAQAAKATYVYTTNLLTKLKAVGLVAFEKKGRLKRVFLTEQGVLIASALEALVQKFDLPKQVAAPPAVPPAPPAPGEDRAIV